MTKPLTVIMVLGLVAVLAMSVGACGDDDDESAVGINGDKQGSARLFATQAEAKDYAAEVAKEGEQTTIVGTVVFQADTQDDADFFADAYE